MSLVLASSTCHGRERSLTLSIMIDYEPGTSTGRSKRPAAETREHVLDVAERLFYWNGIRATGVDAVAREAGVAPTTLYRLFASKDELVAAYVDREDRLYREGFDVAVEAGGPGARGRILSFFDALAEQVRPDRCRGCPFQMA